MDFEKVFVVFDFEYEDDRISLLYEPEVKGVFKNKEDAQKLYKKLADDRLERMKSNAEDSDELEIEIDESEQDNNLYTILNTCESGMSIWTYEVRVVEMSIN